MGFSNRLLLVAPDERIYRLANAKFDRMLRDAQGPVLPDFAGQRVHMASLIVELADRASVRVVRCTYAIVTFDADGRMDSSRFMRQQWARAESALDSGLATRDKNRTVLDAAALFVAQGGAWKPSNTLARSLDDAALGRTACRRA